MIENDKKFIGLATLARIANVAPATVLRKINSGLVPIDGMLVTGSGRSPQMLFALHRAETLRVLMGKQHPSGGANGCKIALSN